MKIKQISVKRKFNLGNYETQDIELIAFIDDKEKVDDVFKKLKIKVMQLGKMKVIIPKKSIKGGW